MFEDLQIRPEQAPPIQTPAPSLDEVLALIAGDAERQAPQYLEETVVPHGGE